MTKFNHERKVISFSGSPYNCRMRWHRRDIRPRVEARLKALGKILDDVLPGYSFFAPSNLEGGATTSILSKLADGLGWSLCELLCETRTDLIKLAVTAALRAIRSDRAEVIPDAVIKALDMLEGYERDGLPIDEAVLGHIERSLRALYRDR